MCTLIWWVRPVCRVHRTQHTWSFTVQQLHIRARRLAGMLGQIHHRHAQAVARIPADRQFDAHLRAPPPWPVGHGLVLALHFATPNHADQRIHRGPRLGHHHQATGVLVQTVDDACARNTGAGGIVGQQSH
jgi:hypothetical protein